MIFSVVTAMSSSIDLEGFRVSALSKIEITDVLTEISAPNGLKIVSRSASNDFLFAILVDLSGSQALWTKSKQENSNWEKVTELPAEMAHIDSMVYQFNGQTFSLYLNGKNEKGAFGLWEFNISNTQWKKLQLSKDAFVELGTPVGLSHVLYKNPGSGDTTEIGLFNTVTGSLHEVGVISFPFDSIRLMNRSKSEPVLVIEQGHERKEFLLEFAKNDTGLHEVDIMILIIYCIALLALGGFFAKRGKSTHDYFLGGKRIPGWASGISIIATSTSAISLLSLPALSYATDWSVWPILLGPLLAAPFVIIFVLPVFFDLNITTPYEFLEKRFGLIVRLIGSCQFLIYEICRTGVLIVLPSLVLSVITGIDVTHCIIVVGIVATIYTLMGGFEAVVWTDVLQTTIMLGGVLFSVVFVFIGLGEEAYGMLSDAIGSRKLDLFRFDLDLSSLTFVVFLLYLPTVVNSYVSHQPTVQRYLATSDRREAKRALWSAGVIGPFILLLFFAAGTSLYLFYQHFPERMNVDMNTPDELFAWFIINELPVGMQGLLIGAIFAATMSSLDSGLSSISTVIVTDFYKRIRKKKDDDSALRIAKWIVGLFGVMGTLFGIWIAQLDVKYLFNMFIEFMQLLSGGIAGVFFLGMFTKRANSIGVIIGLVLSSMCVYWAKAHTNVSFYLYGIIGTMSSLLLGYASSWWVTRNQKSI